MTLIVLDFGFLTTASKSDGMAAVKSRGLRYSYMKQPSLIKQLQNILEEYPDGGQILKVNQYVNLMTNIQKAVISTESLIEKIAFCIQVNVL